MWSVDRPPGAPRRRTAASPACCPTRKPRPHPGRPLCPARRRRHGRTRRRPPACARSGPTIRRRATPRCEAAPRTPIRPSRSPCR
ncbi:hypothetical protein D3093_31380 (plasmid) [Azospirillum argentinense]|uniref:Uncharacterized protein n=1 Tax=Azospirillum argentinense TaxID=2970906 RepID=A0A4D8PR14_9PROT|nr:hypothetical protein D3093_31380 [Azospirillum argentinense]